MVSSSSNSTSGSVESSNVNGLETHQPFTGSNPTETVSDNSDDSATLSTPLLIGIIAASVVVFVVFLFVVRSRQRRIKPKSFSPSNISAFHGVTSTTALGHSSNALRSSTASTAMASPQPMLRTFRLPRFSTKDAAGEEIVVDIHDEHSTQASATTSSISGRPVFSASVHMLGRLGSSISSLTAFRQGRNSGLCATNSTVSIANSVPSPVGIERDTCRDLSETCWSIGPDSDSETESEQFTMPTSSHAPVGALVLNRNHLSTLPDDLSDIEDLDDSSRRRGMSTLYEVSSRRERDTNEFAYSSSRQVRGLSALEGRGKANSGANVDTNNSGDSYFSVGSDTYDEMIKGPFLFEDSDSDSDGDHNVREEEF